MSDNWRTTVPKVIDVCGRALSFRVATIKALLAPMFGLLAYVNAKPVDMGFLPLIFNGNVTFTYGLEKTAAKFRTFVNIFLDIEFFILLENVTKFTIPFWTYKITKFQFCILVLGFPNVIHSTTNNNNIHSWASYTKYLMKFFKPKKL